VAESPFIAIVDDGASVRKATATLLESYGYSTAAFGSAEAFLRSGRVSGAGCLVTDLYMPGINGVELRRHLVGAGHRLPTIFITAHADGHMHAQALKCGPIALLLKPVTEQRLLASIEDALRSAREMRRS